MAGSRVDTSSFSGGSDASLCFALQSPLLFEPLRSLGSVGSGGGAGGWVGGWAAVGRITVSGTQTGKQRG